MKKKLTLYLHEQGGDIFWVLVFLAPLYLYDIPNIWEAAGYTLSGYLSNCSKLSILKSNQIVSPFLFLNTGVQQCTTFLSKPQARWRRSELCTLLSNKQDELI